DVRARAGRHAALLIADLLADAGAAAVVAADEAAGAVVVAALAGRAVHAGLTGLRGTRGGAADVTDVLGHECIEEPGALLTRGASRLRERVAHCRSRRGIDNDDVTVAVTIVAAAGGEEPNEQGSKG